MLIQLSQKEQFICQLLQSQFAQYRNLSGQIDFKKVRDYLIEYARATYESEGDKSPILDACLLFGVDECYYSRKKIKNMYYNL